MTSLYDPPLRFPCYPEPRIQNRACSRSRHDIFMQHLTLKTVCYPLFHLDFSLILYPVKPTVGTHMGTCVGVLVKVVDRGVLFANPEFWYHVLF